MKPNIVNLLTINK